MLKEALLKYNKKDKGPDKQGLLCMERDEQILFLRLSVVSDHSSNFYIWFLQVLLVP